MGLRIFVAAALVMTSMPTHADDLLERLDDLGAGLGCLDVALADVDADGDLDVLVANAFSDDVTVIRVSR